MKSNIPFSAEEIDHLIDQLQALMVSAQRQSTDDRAAIQTALPTLDRATVDHHLATGPATPEDTVRQIKQMIQYLIGKEY